MPDFGVENRNKFEHSSVKTANYTATLEDFYIPVDSTTANFTVTLPTAVNNKGLTYLIYKTQATNTVTIDGDGTETINGASTLVLSLAYQTVRLHSDGTGWIASSFSIDDLLDVTITTPAQYDTLVRNGTGQWINLAKGVNGSVMTIGTTGILEWDLLDGSNVDPAGTVARKDIANTWTSLQTFKRSGSTGLEVQRESATTSVGIYYGNLDSAAAMAAIGSIRMQHTNNTVGALDGKFAVFLQRNNVDTEYLTLEYLSGNGSLRLFESNRVIMNNSGLTANRTYTFPDSNQTFLGRTDTATVTGKTIDSASNPPINSVVSPQVKKTGYIYPDALSNSQFGTLGRAAVAGTGTFTNDTTHGRVVSYDTGTTANSRGGWLDASATTPLGNFMIAGNFIFKLKFKIASAAQTTQRIYIGFVNAVALPTSDTMIGNTESGILFGQRTTDTNYQIFHNDGATAMTTTAYGDAIAPSNTWRILTIIANSTTPSVSFQLDSGTVTTITTDLPAIGTGMLFRACVQNSSTTAKKFDYAWAWAESNI